MSLVIMTEDSIICARDMMGRLPIIIGKRSDGYCFLLNRLRFRSSAIVHVMSLRPARS